MPFLVFVVAFVQFSLSAADLNSDNDTRSIANNVLGAMNASVEPCDDFYQYACGSWINATKIPEDRTSYTKSISVVHDRVRVIVRGIVENETEATDSQYNDQSGSIAKARALYQSCISQHSTGPLTTSFLQPFSGFYRKTRNAETFSREMSRLGLILSPILFNLYIGLDDKNPSQYTIFISQISLGLPHRDNYLKNTERDVEMRKRYSLFIEYMLMAAHKANLLLRTDYRFFAKQVLKFETDLANNSLPPDELRDPEVIYNKRQIEDMPKTLHLSEFFKNAGIDPTATNGSVVIDNPTYFQYLSRVMSELDNDIHKRSIFRGYLSFRLAFHATSNGLLGEQAYSEFFKLEQFIYGVEKMEEKWKICLSITTDMLGDAVGRAFVADHFKQTQLNAATSLSEGITQAFNETLTELHWMDNLTKQSARAKLSALDWKIGYSPNLRTYEDVKVMRDDLSANIREGLLYKSRRAIARLGKPASRTEWFMYPHQVNAYYAPVRNEMVFPAGILQPSFFSAKHPDAMNFGGIGVVIGHELLHGFDNSGRKYNERGELRSWWSNASAKVYENRSKCYVDVYNKYKPVDIDLNVNGVQTLGENIADANGLKMAFKAFKTTNHRHGSMSPQNFILEKNFTSEQLFFISYAQLWCQVYRPEALKVRIRSGVHSPAQFRVEGPLSMSDDFAKAFQCKPGTRYNPFKKCTLW